MQSFLDIAKNWLSAVAENQLNIPFQVVETNSCETLAHGISQLANEQPLQIFNVEYTARQVLDPYQLFHQITWWFGETYGHEYIERLIDESCYQLHVEPLKHWYQRTPYFRKEPLIFDEAAYEQSEFFIGVERMLNKLAELQPFVVLINHIEAAPYQIIQALNQLLSSPETTTRWGVMGFIAPTQLSRLVEEKSAWHECLKLIERKGLILPAMVNKADVQSFTWQRPANLKSFDDQYHMLLAATDLFAYQDVERIVEQIRHKFNDKHNGQLLFLSAYSALMSGDHDTAIRRFNQAQNRLQATDTEGILIASYFWQSICYTLKAQEKFARAAQEQCEKLAIEYDDNRWYALAQYAGFFIDAYIAQHRLRQASLESLRYLLSELGYTNVLSLVLTQVYSQTEGYDSVSSKTYLKNCVTALRFARTKKNMLGISIALHAMGVVHMRVGNFRQTQRLYEMSLKLRERYQRNASLVPMLNGLGYFFVGQENWPKAWQLYDRALSLLIQHRKFNEVSITLYNFVWLYTQSGNTQRALDTMNDLLELMLIRGIESVPFRNLKDLYILKGWLHLNLQQPIQARNCLIRVESFPHLHETSFSKILTSILTARIAFYEGETATAIFENNKAYRLTNSLEDLDMYLDTSLKLEIARLFMDLDRRDQAQPIFTYLRDIAFKFNLQTLAQSVTRASLGITQSTECSVPAIAQPYHILLELAQKETQLTRMQHSLADIHQVNLLVEQSGSEPDIDKFIEQTIEILDRRVPANELAIVVRNYERSEHEIDYLVTKTVSDETVEGWLKKLSLGKEQDVYFEFNDDQCAAWPMHMGTADISWLIISGDRHQKAVWNEDFLRLVAQQLGLILDRRLREAYLEYRNKTDLLTGVMNRAGIYERLNKIFAQMKRQSSQTFALCYFDLDHFKYFNDKFGHDLGDRVLINLVRTIESQLRGSDELGRLGGDEFILLLKGSCRDALETMLERLRCNIAKPDWWLPLFAKETQGNGNPVPAEHWISASFGVVMVDEWPPAGVSQIELLAQGDAAMYEAKAKGRNCVVVSEYRPES